jgi:acetyl esterase/lipase
VAEHTEQRDEAQPHPHPSADRAPNQRQRRRLTRRAIAARALLVLLFLIGVYCSLTPPGRAATRTALLLPALITQTVPPPLALMGEPVRHRELTVRAKSGPVFLDIYEPTPPAPPAPGAREAVLLIPGVGDNRKEPQLINLAEAMARSGLVAVSMTTPTLIAYTLAPDDSDAVVEAFLAMGQAPGVDLKRSGILGFSAGGALATFAAADPRIRDTIAFITLFGGYYDVRTMLGDVGRRAQTVDGKAQAWQPNAVTLQVLANTIATDLPSADAAQLTGAFSTDPFTPLSDLEVDDLSAPGAAAYHLLAGDAPSDVDANVATVTQAMTPLLDGLSPRTAASGVRTVIYLLHDRNDGFVPFTESRAYDAALTQLGKAHRYAEFGIFQHVEVRADLGIGPLLSDLASLYGIVSGLLAPAS